MIEYRVNNEEQKKQEEARFRPMHYALCRMQNAEQLPRPTPHTWLFTIKDTWYLVPCTRYQPPATSHQHPIPNTNTQRSAFLSSLQSSPHSWPMTYDFICALCVKKLFTFCFFLGSVISTVVSQYLVSSHRSSTCSLVFPAVCSLQSSVISHLKPKN